MLTLAVSSVVPPASVVSVVSLCVPPTMPVKVVVPLVLTARERVASVSPLTVLWNFTSPPAEVSVVFAPSVTAPV